MATSRDDRLMRVIDHLLERLDELQVQLDTEKANLALEVTHTESLRKIIEAPDAAN